MHFEFVHVHFNHNSTQDLSREMLSVFRATYKIIRFSFFSQSISNRTIQKLTKRNNTHVKSVRLTTSIAVYAILLGVATFGLYAY